MVRKADVLVLGAGLAGLSALHDLVRHGVDAMCLEARSRVGGRTEEIHLPDGRTLQGGGEVVGASHQAYIGLATELGFQLTPAYASLKGAMSWDLVDGSAVSDRPPWMTESDYSEYEALEAEIDILAASVDHRDPWSRPDFHALDNQSVGGWARTKGVSPSAMRMLEIRFGAISAGAADRGSLMGELRRRAALKTPFTLAVDGGSGALAARLGDQLADRIVLSTPIASISLHPHGVEVTTAGGETIEARAAICTIPVSVLRTIPIAGLSSDRAASLHAQRHALMAKICVAFDRPIWEERGASGMLYSENGFGAMAPSGDRILSIMIRPENIAHHLAAPSEARKAEVVQTLRQVWGDDVVGAVQDFVRRDWATDPYTLGAVACYAPGDLAKIGPLHGKSEPPLFFAGSDHWSCGYLEGAVETGRNAAGEAMRYLD